MHKMGQTHTPPTWQAFLQITHSVKFIMKSKWPPAPPDANPLDFFLWNAVKSKGCKRRMGKPFKNDREFQLKIKSVWNEFASEKKLIRKAFTQFVPRLHSVVENRGHSIKMLYGWEFREMMWHAWIILFIKTYLILCVSRIPKTKRLFFVVLFITIMSL